MKTTLFDRMEKSELLKTIKEEVSRRSETIQTFALCSMYKYSICDVYSWWSLYN